MDAKTIGKIIKTARGTKGLSQRALAKRLGVSSSAVSEWEKGSRVPAGDTLVKMANILCVVHKLFPNYAAEQVYSTHKPGSSGTNIGDSEDKPQNPQLVDTSAFLKEVIALRNEMSVLSEKLKHRDREIDELKSVVDQQRDLNILRQSELLYELREVEKYREVEARRKKTPKKSTDEYHKTIMALDEREKEKAGV